MIEQAEKHIERISELTEKIATEPENVKLYQKRGERYFRLNDYDKAIADYTQLIELDPENVIALSYRGRCYYKIKKYDEAIADFDKALTFDPENKKASTYRKLCHEHLNKSNMFKEEHLRTLEKEHSKDHSAELISYLQNEDHDKALNFTNQLIKFAPENIDNYSNRGFIYFAKKEFDNAVKEFDNAIKIKPGKKNSYIQRGIAYLYMKKKDEAVKDFDKFFEFFPENSNYSVIRGAYYFGVKRDQALNDLDRFVALDPENSNNYTMRGVFHLLKKKENEAADDFTKAIELEPKKSVNYLLRYLSRNLPGKKANRLNDLEKCIELDPKNQLGYSVIDALIRIMNTDEDVEEFINIFEGRNEGPPEADKLIQAIFQMLSRFASMVASVIDKKENEKIQLRTDIFQAVSHTISNIMLANKTITKRIRNGTNSENDVNRLELLNDLVLSTMKAVKLAFSKEDIVVSKAPDDLSLEKIHDGISLYDLLCFCLNINLNYLVSGEGEEGWATIRNVFFSIDRYDKKNVAEKLAMLKEMRKSPHFSISELSHDQINSFMKTFHSETFQPIHHFFAIQTEELRDFYVRKDSYTFSVLFIILLELTKNMLRYGTIQDKDARKFTMKSEINGNDLVLTLANTCQKSRLNLKESTLKGLAMIQEFSKVLGRFEKTEREIESDLLEFTTKLFIRIPNRQEAAQKESYEENSVG